MRMRPIRLMFGMIAVLALSSTAFGQATAQISGTVQDATGALIPGAEVTVTQIDTGANRLAVTNETGSYVLTSLPIGPYRLEAVLPGFQTFVQTGIVLQVNGAPVVNVTLNVGQVTQTIEVQANAAMVETRTVGVGQMMAGAQLLELPLNGRNATELILLSGGAVDMGETSNTSFAGRLRVCGSRSGVARVMERCTVSTESSTILPTTAWACPCRFPMRWRSSGSKPAGSRQRTGDPPRWAR